MDETQQGSAVAALRVQMELEYQAGRRGLSAFRSGAAQHRFINARLRQIDVYYQQMALMIGEERAAALLCEIFEDRQHEI